MQSGTAASQPASATRKKVETHSYTSSTTKTKPSGIIHQEEDVRPTTKVHIQQLNFTRRNPWPENNFSVYIGKPAWI
jgi:hypothetical protein